MANTLGASVLVNIEELAERTGLWCEACLLPSRCEWDFVTTYDGKPAFPWTYSYCADCDAESTTNLPEGLIP